jgi:chlorite dismutase
MDTHPYHHYLFFSVGPDFYQLSKSEQDVLKSEFETLISGAGNKEGDGLIITSYATLGFKANTTFMLWCRGKRPENVQGLLRELLRTHLGKYLWISCTYFGIVRNSEYSGRTGKPEQVMQTYEERLPYFVLYPFTKTSEWHALGFDARRAIMGEHIKVGVGHPAIRQCLLYSYGVDDHEFLVSYEMKTLEEFQDLVVQMRRTAGRKYTLVDTPTFTCIYKTPAELMKWL